MKCVKCRGEMHESRSVYVADLGRCCIVVRNVPCVKCDECGETVYSGTVLAKLEELVDVLQGALTEVAVVNYPEGVA